MLCLIPHIIECNEHSRRQQITGQLGNIQHRVFIIQVDIGALVKGAGRAVYQAVEDICQTFGFGCDQENIIQVTQNRHFSVTVGIVWVFERVIVMGDPLGIVGLDQGFIQKLPFFVSDVGDQQAEKDVQLLNFGGKLRFLNRSAVQQFIHRPIGLAYLHDIDAVFRCRRDLNELAARIAAGTQKFVPFQRSNDEYLGAFSPHPQCHQLQGEGFACAAGPHDCNVGVLIGCGIENIHDHKGIVIFVDAEQNAIVIAQLISGKGIAACSPACQHIALGALIQMLFQICQRQR